MKNIKIYTTPSCVYCKMAKQLFEKHGAAYFEVNVAEDEQAREEMLAKSHQMAVPVIDIDGQIFVGFDRASLEKVLTT